jgi:hypothetical protein
VALAWLDLWSPWALRTLISTFHCANEQEPVTKDKQEPVKRQRRASEKTAKQESTKQYRNLRVDFDIALLTLASPLQRRTRASEKKTNKSRQSNIEIYV